MREARLLPILALLSVAIGGPTIRAQDAPAGGKAAAELADRPGVCLVSADDQLLITPSHQERMAATNRWEQATLRVAFVDGGDARYNVLRRKIEAFAKEWEAFANIRFAFQRVAEKDVDGAITDRDLDVAIRLEPTQSFRVGAYQSFYGPQSHKQTHADPPAPSMWLVFPLDAKDQEIRRVTLHEFGHALGMIHEQQRPDLDIRWNRAAVLKYYRFTGWSKDTIEAQVMRPFQGRVIAATPFDPTSIMIYPIPHGLVSNYEAGWTRELSPMDKVFIGTVYPFSAIAPPRNLKLDAETAVEIARAGEIDCYRIAIGRDGQYEVKSSGSPSLIALMGSPSIGPTTRAPAAEGDPASFVAELKADSPNNRGDKPGTYYLYVRHKEGRTGTGHLKVQVRPLTPLADPGGRP